MPPVSPIPPPLTPDAVATVMQLLTQTLLGLYPVDPSDPAYQEQLEAANFQVRVGWQQEGQPSQRIDQDVAYLRAVEDDDPVNRQRDVQFFDRDATTVQQITTYTRVWRVFWTLEGPNSFDRVRIVRSGLYTQVPHDILASQNVALYAVMDISAPRYMLFPYGGGQWWKRTDFDCQFNELVTEETIVSRVASAEVLVYTDRSPDIDHPERDIVVVTP